MSLRKKRTLENMKCPILHIIIKIEFCGHYSFLPVDKIVFFISPWSGHVLLVEKTNKRFCLTCIAIEVVTPLILSIYYRPLPSQNTNGLLVLYRSVNIFPDIITRVSTTKIERKEQVIGPFIETPRKKTTVIRSYYNSFLNGLWVGIDKGAWV